MRIKKFFLLMVVGLFTLSTWADSGKEIFETYCWGCHHQTAVAFGPPFEEIASKRSDEEIRAMIFAPKTVSKVLGYKRNAMPAFPLSDDNLTAITAYILSFKPTENNQTAETNSTIKGHK